MMPCKRLWFLSAALAAMLATLGSPGRASAQFSVTFSTSGSPSGTIVDNGPGDSDPTLGRISISNFIYDGYNINTTSGFSNAPGGLEARLEISALNVTNVSDVEPVTSPVFITYSDTFVTPVTGTSTVLTRLTNLEDGPTITFQSGVNAATGGTLTRTTFGADQTVFTTTVTQPTFSMRAISSIANIPLGRTASFQGLTVASIPQVQGPPPVVVPVPSGLVFLLSALPVFGLVRYRNRSRYLQLA
jgi:hypothetical protein